MTTATQTTSATQATANTAAVAQATAQAPVAQRQKCEIWTRVMGYHRPVSQYNKGKKSEFYSRVCFSEQASENSCFVAKFSK